MAELVSKTYAEALFDLAMETDQVEVFLEAFGQVNSAFQSHPDFLMLYKSPQISGLEKKQILDQVFGDALPENLMHFLKLLIDKSRAIYVERIYSAYVERVELYKKECTAIVSTVVGMTDAQKETLANQLTTMTGKKVTVDNRIDTSIVGGVMIKIGDQVLDGTLRRKLVDLKESLSQVTV